MYININTYNVCFGLTKKFVWVFPYDVMENPNELFDQPNICFLFFCIT